MNCKSLFRSKSAHTRYSKYENPDLYRDKFYSLKFKVAALNSLSINFYF